MLRIKLVSTIILALYISSSYSKDLPPIYISPNPNKINIDLHSSNPHIIKLNNKNTNYSLSDILKSRSNLSTSQSGGIASQNQLRIRGGEANHILILLDGIEINDASSGSEYDFSHLYSFNIKDIEILKGAYSTVHGPDAISGVVNIKTQNLNGANLITGSNNTSIKNYSFAGENKNFQYGIDINLLESSGTDTSGSSGDRNRYENDNIRINVKSINHNFSLFYFDIYRQNDRDSNGNVSDNENATTDINQIYSQYYYKNRISKNIFTKQGIQYATNKNLDFGPSNGVWETITQSEKLKTFLVASINLKEYLIHENNSSLSVGLEYEKINFTQLVLNQAYGNGNQNQGEYSGSITSELILPWKDFQIELGYRKTINQKFNNNNSHRFGLTYKINNGKIFFNHSTSFKNPTFTERYGYYPGSFNGNPNLKPENIRQYEIGYSYDFIESNIKIMQTLYNTKLKNEINGYTSDGNGGYTALNLSNNSYRKGLETALIFNINQNSKLSVRHDYIDSTQYNSTKKIQDEEVRRPKNLVNIDYDNSLSNFLHINSNILYSSKIKDTDFSSWPYNAIYLNDYFIFNTTLNLKLDNNNKMSLILKNIFNRKYNEVYGYSNPGLELLINYNKKF